MHIHKPKPLHGAREFLGEVAVILVGILIAIALEQGVETIRWRHEIGEARTALGQEVTYNLGVLKDMQAQNRCIAARLDQLKRWADGAGPRPSDAEHRPVYFTLQTSTWDVTNSGQVVAHFPLDQKIRFARTYARFDNERSAVAEERDAWQTIASISADPTLDDTDRRELRHAIGLARAIAQRRRGNAGLILREGPPLAVAGGGPEYGRSGTPADFCRAAGMAPGE